MSTWRLRLFGITIAEIQIAPDPVEEEVEEDLAIGGGSCHDFERDGTPLNPDDRYAPWDGIGFH